MNEVDQLRARIAAHKARQVEAPPPAAAPAATKAPAKKAVKPRKAKGGSAKGAAGKGSVEYRREYLAFAREIVSTPALHRRGGLEWAQLFLKWIAREYPAELDAPETDTRGQSLLFGKGR